MPRQTVVETPGVIRRANDIGLTDEDRDVLITYLAENPEAGVSLGSSLGDGFRQGPCGPAWRRKARRLSHTALFRTPEMPIFLLAVLAKKEKANISQKQRARLI